MKLKLLIILMLASLGASAQYSNFGTGQLQRQVSGGDTTYRWVGTGVGNYLYGKSLSWYRNNFALDANVLHKTGNETATDTKTIQQIIANNTTINDAAILVSRNLGGATLSRGFRDATVVSSTHGQGYNAYDAIPNFVNTIFANHLAMYQSRPYYNGSGGTGNVYGFIDFPDIVKNATNVISFDSAPNAYPTGSIGSRIGYRARDMQSNIPASLGYNYGLRVEYLQRGTKNLAIYTDGATPSILGGALSVGYSDSTRVNSYTLDVNGDSRVNGGLEFGSSSFIAGKNRIYNSATLGAVWTGFAGSSYEFFMANSSGNAFLQVPTGTVNAEFQGNVIASTAPTSGSHLTNKTYVDNAVAGVTLVFQRSSGNITPINSGDRLSITTSSGTTAITAISSSGTGNAVYAQAADYNAISAINTSSTYAPINVLNNGSGALASFSNGTLGEVATVNNNGSITAPLLGYTKTLVGSGTGVATTISIAHGLSGITTSSAVVVTPNNAASAGISYATVDATNVNIVYTVAPANGTNNLLYSVTIK